MSQNERRSSLRIDPDTTPARLIAVNDVSQDAVARSRQVIEAFAKAIQLSAKRGRIARRDEEGIDAAA